MKLKIALINPALDHEEEYGVFKCFATPAIPAGVGFLAGYMRDKGFTNIKLFDEQLSPLNNKKTLQDLIGFNPDIIGISCYTNLYSHVLKLACMIKSILSQTKIIIGSSHPTLEPDTVIQNDNIDFLIRGEGEKALFQFLENFRTGDYSNVDGLTYKKDGRIVHNRDLSSINNLDELPFFPYDLFATLDKRYDIGKYVSSRGCPYRCTFCSTKWISARYREHSANRVVEDIEFIVNKYGINHIEFYDDDFNINRKRTASICELILKKGLKIRWKGQTRSDSFNLDLLKLMKRAGCYFISLGFESGSNRILKLMNKAETVEGHMKAVEMIKKVGVNVGGGFIIGFPTETKEDTDETIKFMKRLKLDYARFSLFAPYPGTAILKTIRKEGKKLEWDLINPTAGLSQKKRLAYVPEGRTEEELIKIQRWYSFCFWLKFKIICKFLKGEVSPYGIPHRVTIKEALLITQFILLYLLSLMKRR